MLEKELLVFLIFVAMTFAFDKGGYHYKKKGAQSTYREPSRPPGGPISADMMCALCLFYGWYDGIMRFCYSGSFIPPAYGYSSRGDGFISYLRALTHPGYGHRYHNNGDYGNYGTHYHNHKFPKHKLKTEGYYH